MNDNYKFETQCLHAGQQPDPATTARGVPVYRTSSYVFIEQRIAALEGGAAALALASGTSAVYYSIINICEAGDEIVSATNLYGGTYTMFDCILPQFGLKVNFADARDPDSFAKAITEKTRAVFIETIGNPVLEFTDISAVAEIAHSHNLPLIVDATFTSPYLLKSIEHGADIVVNSLTKWMGGHGTGIGGVVIDSGKFNWQDPKFKLYNEPDPSYHDIRYAHDLGDMNPIAFILRMRLVPLRNLGACISPDNAWMFLQGLETLPLRMQRHCENASAVARFLKEHANVDWVRYPGLEDDPTYPVASKYLKNGFGGMVVFGIKGGLEAGQKFVDSLKLFSHLANVGDAKSLHR
jgi:O-acetylhomoserine (thiol)-lyase